LLAFTLELVLELLRLDTPLASVARGRDGYAHTYTWTLSLDSLSPASDLNTEIDDTVSGYAVCMQQYIVIHTFQGNVRSI